MIYADTQNLGIQSRKLGLGGLIRRDLTRSYGGEGQGVESQHDVLAPEFGQRIFAPQMRFECEVRGQLSNLKFHSFMQEALPNLFYIINAKCEELNQRFQIRTAHPSFSIYKTDYFGL